MDFISVRSLLSGAFLLASLYLALKTTISQQDSGQSTVHVAKPFTQTETHSGVALAPKILIISFFSLEGNIWHEHLPQSGLGDLKAQAIHVPGLSPQFPWVHCTTDGDICQVTTAMSEINAASTITSVILSNKFDLQNTYFLLAGIAGVNPKYGTLGSVALARFAIQVALQYEIDPREMPAGWSTGYFSFGTQNPVEYPAEWYGTEVFELNTALRDVAFDLASRALLNDTDGTQEYRSKYNAPNLSHQAATKPPSLIKCDTSTSDVFFSGNVLGQTFENVTELWTSGLGKYCMSAQEDNAVLEVLLRLHLEKLVDFSRVMLLRAGSNFDRPPPGADALTHLRGQHLNGVTIALANIYLVGVEIVKGIVRDWDEVFLHGIETSNYLGDVLGTLGGTPDFIPARN